MSHLMTALAMRQTGLKPAAKIVLYWLADHHNSETGLCCPSLRKLSEETEMSRTAVIRHLTDLEEKGLISRTKRTRDNGSQRSSEYDLNLEESLTNRRSSFDTGVVSNLDGGWSQTDTPLTLEESNLGKEQEGGSDEPALFSEIEDPNPSTQTQDDLFEEFWKVYPKKAGKGGAKKAWPKAIKKAPAEEIINAARKYAKWLSTGSKADFRPIPKHPQGWLNDERWTDAEIQDVVVGNRSASEASYIPHIERFT